MAQLQQQQRMTPDLETNTQGQEPTKGEITIFATHFENGNDSLCSKYKELCDKYSGDSVDWALVSRLPDGLGQDIINAIANYHGRTAKKRRPCVEKLAGFWMTNYDDVVSSFGKHELSHQFWRDLCALVEKNLGRFSNMSDVVELIQKAHARRTAAKPKGMPHYKYLPADVKYAKDILDGDLSQEVGRGQQKQRLERVNHQIGAQRSREQIEDGIIKDKAQDSDHESFKLQPNVSVTPRCRAEFDLTSVETPKKRKTSHGHKDAHVLSSPDYKRLGSSSTQGRTKRKISNFMISRRLLNLVSGSLSRLQRNACYNDDIIDCAMQTLQSALPHTFGYIPVTSKAGKDVESLRQFADRTSGIVAIPIQIQGNHWVVAVLHCTLAGQYITIWDSLIEDDVGADAHESFILLEHDSTSATTSNSRNIRDSKYKNSHLVLTELSRLWARASSAFQSATSLPQCKLSLSCPQQKNSKDSGVSVITVCASLAAGLVPPTTSTMDWELWRVMISKACGEGTSGCVTTEVNQMLTYLNDNIELSLKDTRGAEDRMGEECDESRAAIRGLTVPRKSLSELRDFAIELQKIAELAKVLADKKEQEQARVHRHHLFAIMRDKRPQATTALFIGETLLKNTEARLNDLKGELIHLQSVKRELELNIGKFAEGRHSNNAAITELTNLANQTFSRIIKAMEEEIEIVTQVIKYRLKGLYLVALSWHYKLEEETRK
ncbi:hypothetical protein F4680DRAFT_393688 [Xylaria scruposa]|nr:hypothetical protein F4680DRAFT_393688 [Xylaria scruposa]